MKGQVMDLRKKVRREKRLLVGICCKVTDLYVESNRVIDFTVAQF